MIKAINNQRLIMLCSECGQEKNIPLDSLLAGIEAAPNIIVLRCPDCPNGAVEFLNRTWDNPGGHARMVNSLHAHLVKTGRVSPSPAERIGKELEAEKPFNAEDLLEVAISY